jgi:hypothetical protein
MHGALIMTDYVPSAGKQDYFARRAAQERELAGRSADRSARHVHHELASRYAVLAESPEVTVEQPRASQPA